MRFALLGFENLWRGGKKLQDIEIIFIKISYRFDFWPTLDESGRVTFNTVCVPHLEPEGEEGESAIDLLRHQAE